MNKTRTGTVYTLTDPRDGRIRYIGKTEKNILDRLAGHLASPSNPAMRVWLNALALQGLTPHINAIATHPVDKLAAEEEKQIKAHARAGHRIFNAPHYHQNLSDLYQATTGAAAQVMKVDGSATDNADRYAHAIYGAVAAARAAGQMSRARTITAVLLRAPILALVMLWQMAFGIALIRRLLITAAACWWLWDIGFDHLMREQVLPHLPVHEAVQFWHEYLADPLLTMSLYFSAVHLLGSLLLYASVADAAKADRPEPSKPAQRSLATNDLAAAAGAALAAVDLKNPPPPATSGLVKQRPAPEAPPRRSEQD